MRILWFTNTPSNASTEFGYKYMGGGWISALENIVVEENSNELGICFFYEGAAYKKLEKNKVSYYGIPLQKENGFERLFNRHNGILNDNQSDFIDTIIKDFVPDVVHVFGTEMGYGKMLVNKFPKVVFHLQGLIAPYAEVYFPPDFTKRRAFFGNGLNAIVRGLTLYNQYSLFKTRGKRELEIIGGWKYFMGRTDWDKNYTKLINPQATYFHCDELLRDIFFANQWKAPAIEANKIKIIIGTTINPNVYKGLDLIYKVIPLLKNFSLEWKIFGIKEDSQLNDTIKKLVKVKTTYPQLKFFGQTASQELIQELKTCHFFVHPSYIDNSPNSVCEAMLMGMPVIASSVGGVNSLITHKKNGYLFNPHDKYDLAGIISYLCNHYTEAIDCGVQARENALIRHNPQSILKSLNTIYNSIYND